MPVVRYGGKKGRSVALDVSPEHMVIRTRSRRSLTRPAVSARARDALGKFRCKVRFAAAGVEVHRLRDPRGGWRARDRARRVLEAEPDVQFAGRLLVERKGRTPAIYTENLFVKFHPDWTESWCLRLLAQYGLTVERQVAYVANGYFLGAPEGCGQQVFKIARQLLREESVELCHPELIKAERRRRAFSQQWHLAQTTIDDQPIDAHAGVQAAWALSEGEGVVIAVIDDGFDLDHEEFATPGKIVSPRDETSDSDDPRPRSARRPRDGMRGVACADGLFGASGVAPKAKLMPVRLVSGIGSQDEADALHWAAEHGADVISCSWGPGDGDWWRPQDPRHQAVHVLPDSTRLALEWVTANGRLGKGCVVTWAAGNGGGSESTDNDGYASSDRVIAVGACNDQGLRSVYSEVGDALWCCFPSNDFAPTARTSGIWTTDRSGAAGYNPGRTSRGDRRGHYTSNFQDPRAPAPEWRESQRSILAVNPGLAWTEVKEVLRRSCDAIDPANALYDTGGHSTLYGYGRVNAERAVQLAAPPGWQLAPRRIEVAIRVTTDAASCRLRIDDRPARLVDGVVRTYLVLDTPYFLSWMTVGTEGDRLRIDLDDPGVAVDGLPVEDAIAPGETKSAGVLRLTLR